MANLRVPYVHADTSCALPAVLDHSQLVCHRMQLCLTRPVLQNISACRIEFELPPDYKIDVAGVASFEQYIQQLPKAKRRNHRKRQEAWDSLAAGVLSCTYEPLPPGSTKLVDQLWQLYKENADRNGLLVTSERRFRRLHLAAEGLSICVVRDLSQGGRIVCFATGFKCGDTMVSAWCGTGEAPGQVGEPGRAGQHSAVRGRASAAACACISSQPALTALLRSSAVLNLRDSDRPQAFLAVVIAS